MINAIVDALRSDGVTHDRHAGDAGARVEGAARGGIAGACRAGRAVLTGIPASALLPAAANAAPESRVLQGSITDVPGVRVGHSTDSRRPTGCTVVLTEAGAVGGVDVRGAAPGTRETDLLDPSNLVERVHAVLLAGGSAFGLEAATGVVRWLEEHGIGYPAGPVRVPIVPAAILFDLGVGDPSIRPDAASGYEACAAASGDPPAQGSVGAGAGATVGKLFGMARAMKGGVGHRVGPRRPGHGGRDRGRQRPRRRARPGDRRHPRRHAQPGRVTHGGRPRQSCVASCRKRCRRGWRPRSAWSRPTRR